ncbi:CoA transferase [uncultured Jatrophihabitans sp.]|uniref:CoA transferase n=1 Tax=uncultured Jatrophihabitans sp. TaxID=1610747 RepID=UPI0035CA6C8E
MEAPVLLQKLDAAGIPAGVVRTVDEVNEWDQTKSQGLVTTVKHTTLGDISLPGSPLRFFRPGTTGETETMVTQHAAPPVLNADGNAIRRWARTSSPPRP